MTVIVPRGRRFSTAPVRVLGGIGAVAAAGLVLAVFAVDPPYSFISLVLTVAVLGLVAPMYGVMTIAALLPLSTVIGTLGNFPISGPVTAETLVLAFVAGWFARVVWSGHSHVPGRLQLPVLALSALVVTSALVAVAGTLPYDDPVVSGLRQEYLRVLDDFPQRRLHLHPWYTAMRWLAALVLFAACGAAVHRAPDSYRAARQILKMLVLGLTAAAALNVVHFAEAVLASPNPNAVRDYLSWLRINIHYPDLNAAGSVLAMCALVLLAFARTSGRRWWLYGVGFIVTLAALWLAGSRTAIAALLLTIVAGGLLESRLNWSRRGLAVAGALALAAIAGAAFVLWQFPRHRANADPAQALGIRIELFNRSARMIREHPVFGIGVGGYFAESYRYATPGASFGRENAHNDLAQIVSELGITGLAAFLWLLYEALAALVRNREGLVVRPFRVWWLMGITAYLLTGAAGHPLIVFDAAVPFWIAAGTAAGIAPAAALRAGRMVVIALAVAVLITSPIRISAARAGAIDEGPMLAWETDGERTFRDAGTADTIVLKRPVAALTIPLRLRNPGGASARAQVEIALDGEVVSRGVVTTDAWATLPVDLPGNGLGRTLTLTLVEPPAGVRLLVGRLSAR